MPASSVVSRRSHLGAHREPACSRANLYGERRRPLLQLSTRHSKSFRILRETLVSLPPKGRSRPGLRRREGIPYNSGSRWQEKKFYLSSH